VNFAVASDTLVDFVENYIPEADRPMGARPDAGAEAGGIAVGGTGQEVVVYLKNGSMERGVLKRRTNDGVILKLPGLGTIRYANAEIDHIEPAVE